MTGARANGDDRARGLTGAEWAAGGGGNAAWAPSRPAGNNAGDRRRVRRRGEGEGRRDAASGSGEYAFWSTGGYVFTSSAREGGSAG